MQSSHLFICDEAAVLLHLHGDVDDGAEWRKLVPQDLLGHPVPVHVHSVACKMYFIRMVW